MTGPADPHVPRADNGEPNGGSDGPQRHPGEPTYPATPQYPAAGVKQQPWTPDQYRQPAVAQAPVDPGRQWAQPAAQWTEHPDAYPAYPGDQAAAARSKTPLILAAVAALVVVGVVIALLAGWNSADTLDRNAAQEGVRKVLTGDYGLSNVTSVTCPSGVKVREGERFTCTATVGGERMTVAGRIIRESDGTYEVGHPS